MPSITQLLQAMVQKEASDLFFTAGARISMKIGGLLRPISLPELTFESVKEYAYELMNEEQVRQFEATREMNFGYSVPGVGRFRVNVFRQRGAVAMVIRRLSTDIPELVDLGLPAALERLALERRGLVLVVGATGSGKSTSLAAMLEHRNARIAGHILTIEDPIEFVYRHQKSIVNQREVGVDTESYDSALVNALRESPDMIMIGEVRDRSTMQHVINYANTGHLCVSTLHAINAHQALTRILNFFPLDTRNTVLFDLSSCLLGIIAQRLVRTTDGRRVPAVEIFLADNSMRQLIREGRLDEIQERMDNRMSGDMQTFDQALVRLYRDGKITFEEAQANADSPRQLHLLMQAPDTAPEPSSGGGEAAGLPPLPELDLPEIS